ncbi:hypothetical protein BDZ89DRAFT_117942 [Hymenopellis radicata]|nr:hypothetical protein BDZ89DRAFT_117942 [Hymenopellis radicata]
MVFVVDMLFTGHLVVTAHEKPDRSVTLSCDMHSAPLWAFDDDVSPIIRAPGLPIAHAKPLIIKAFLAAVPRKQNENTWCADWHRSGLLNEQFHVLKDVLTANPRVRFTKKGGQYLKEWEDAGDVEVFSPEETLKWFAREDGSLMLARLRYSPSVEPLINPYIHRITKRIRNGITPWGLMKSVREAKREKIRIRKQGKKDRKKVREAQRAAKELKQVAAAEERRRKFELKKKTEAGECTLI